MPGVVAAFLLLVAAGVTANIGTQAWMRRRQVTAVVIAAASAGLLWLAIVTLALASWP